MDEERLARLETRLLRLEDELAITRLVASYGPLVDAGEAEAVAGLWADDGAYDVEGWQMTSRADIRAMVESDGHQGESILVRHREGSYSVRRAGANHFHLRRERDGWRIAHRTTRALDGSAEARDLLSRGALGKASGGAL
jgi:hypothetical protein